MLIAKIDKPLGMRPEAIDFSLMQTMAWWGCIAPQFVVLNEVLGARLPTLRRLVCIAHLSMAF
ncbi:MAG: hypothetical protein VSS75_029535 [Candidatus Parabeggiatoa sp.]|nr:hypothetical protein [Candidatus Parabeggiatoa sp.]